MSTPPSPTTSLRGQDLSGQDLRSLDLRNADLIQATLVGRSLAGKDLSGAQLHGARLRRADLSGVIGHALGAREADLEGVKLAGASLTGATLSSAVLLDADLSGADLTGADLRGADLRAADLSGADLTDADLSGADLEGARLERTILLRTRAAGTRIAGVVGLSPEQQQALLDAGAYSSLLPRLSDRLRQILQRLRPAPAPADATAKAPEAAAEAEGEADAAWLEPLQSLLREGRERTQRLQEQLQERRRRAAEVRGAQEAAWLARREQDAAERRYRRENRGAWRAAQAAQASAAREALRTARAAIRRRRALERRTEVQVSVVLRTAQQEARARLEAAARAEAERLEAVDVAARREELGEELAELADQLEAAEARLRAARERLTAHTAQQAALLERLTTVADHEAEEVEQVAAQTAQVEAARRRVGEAERRLLLVVRARHSGEGELTQEAAARAAVEDASAAAAESLAALEALAAQHAETQAQRSALEAERDALLPEQGRLESGERLARAETERLRRQLARLRATPDTLPSPLQRSVDRAWYQLTDLIARQDPQAAVALDRLRDRLRRSAADLPGRLRQRAEGDAAEQARRAQLRQDREHVRLEALREAPSAEDRRLEARARLEALQQTAEADDPQLPLPAQAAPGLLLRFLNGFWYRLTDLLSVVSPSAAEGLDRAKERLEWEFVSRREAARQARVEQDQEQARVRSQQRRQDRDVRIERLSRLQAAEEDRAQRRAEAEARKVAARVEQERRAALRALSPEARHEQRRQRYAQRVDHGGGVSHRGADLRGKRLGEVEWADADLREARLDAARLDNADLTAARMEGASLEGTRLDGATLDGADLQQARLDGVRARRAAFLGAQLRGVRLVDADLRGADLTGADLSGADLTGADLRRAALFGARLVGANLTAVRLNDVDLGGATLDAAVLDQADLGGVVWEGASVQGADLSGALGLSSAQREALRARGAEAGDVALDDLFSRLGGRQVRLAAAGLVAATAVFLGVAWLLQGDGADPAALEAEAVALREQDPLAASARYVSLAESAAGIEDRLGYLIEAAGLAEAGGDAALATALLDRALETAGADGALSARVQMRRAELRLSQGDPERALADAQDAMQAPGQPAEQRARAVLLYERIAAASDTDPAPVRDALLAELGDVPDAAAQLRLALAELRSTRGDTAGALAELEAIGALEVASDVALRVLETRARVEDRAGDVVAAEETLRTLLRTAEAGSLSWQAATLQLADLVQRDGRTEDALAMIQALLDGRPESVIQGRALLIIGRIHERDAHTREAAETYQQLLSLSSVDMDVQEEARVGLARLLLSEEGRELAAAALADLPAGFAEQVMAQARLGDARRLLDAGDAGAALRLYDEMLDAGSLPGELERAARAGRGEALASLGRFSDAEDVWRVLIADPELPASERIYLELLLANGMLQGGRIDDAATAYASLASAADPEIRAQGRLGMAEVARASGERERARALYQQIADEATDPAWQVQALQELADLALEAGDTAEAIATWRAILGQVPAGDPAAQGARLALVEALAAQGDGDGAQRLCREALAGAPSPAVRIQTRQICAEALERANLPDAALASYQEQLRAEGLTDESFAEAALGAARIQSSRGAHGAVLQVARAGLERATDPAARLQLVTLQLQAADALGDASARAEAEAARDALAASSPQLAGRLLIEAAAQARQTGDLARAQALLEQARTLTLPPDEAASAALELGGVLVERGDLVGARSLLEQAAASGDAQLAFAAGMGLADLEQRRGDPAAAARRYESLTAPDEGSAQWLAEARARALTEAGDPRATEAWAALAALAGADPGMRSASLRGEADALLGRDDFSGALRKYTDAAEQAAEPSGVGWAQLGEAEALRGLERLDEARALLDRLGRHPDAEVALQASIQRARLELGAEAPQAALAALQGRAAEALGPGWDATLAETRAAALVAAGRPDEAEAVLQQLAARWPNEEEAQLPAYLGLADLARDGNRTAQALEWATLALNTARDPAYRDRALDLVEQLDRQ